MGQGVFFVEGSITATFGYEPIDIPQLGNSIRKRFREIHGIFDRDLHGECVGTGLLEPFDHMHLVTVLQARGIQPGISRTPMVSTTRISPSQWPTECPFHSG